MSEAGEKSIEKRLGALVPLVKSLVGGAVAIGAAIVGIGVWVYSQQEANARQDKELHEIHPRVVALETRAVRYDAAPPPTASQFYDLDKRLDRMEQNAGILKEQNAMILQELRNLQGKP